MICATPFIWVRDWPSFPSFRFSTVFSRSSAAFSKNVLTPAFTSSEPDFITVLEKEATSSAQETLTLHVVLSCREQNVQNSNSETWSRDPLIRRVIVTVQCSTMNVPGLQKSSNAVCMCSYLKSSECARMCRQLTIVAESLPGKVGLLKWRTLEAE